MHVLRRSRQDVHIQALDHSGALRRRPHSTQTRGRILAYRTGRPLIALQTAKSLRDRRRNTCRGHAAIAVRKQLLTSPHKCGPPQSRLRRIASRSHQIVKAVTRTSYLIIAMRHAYSSTAFQMSTYQDRTICDSLRHSTRSQVRAHSENAFQYYVRFRGSLSTSVEW